MRLIDADKLDEEIMHFSMAITGNPKLTTVVNECKSSFRRIIDEQPTAYDVDKVVEKLEQMALDTSDTQIGIAARLAYGRTIEIIKSSADGKD